MAAAPTSCAYCGVEMSDLTTSVVHGDLSYCCTNCAGAMEQGVFQRSAPGWLTGDLHGTCDDPRELATGEEE